MSAKFHTKNETIDVDNARTQQIASVQTSAHERVMNVCRSVLQTTNDIARDGAELAGIAAGATINAAIGFTGGFLRGVTGTRSKAKTQKRSNAA